MADCTPCSWEEKELCDRSGFMEFLIRVDDCQQNKEPSLESHLYLVMVGWAHVVRQKRIHKTKVIIFTRFELSHTVSRVVANKS